MGAKENYWSQRWRKVQVFDSSKNPNSITNPLFSSPVANKNSNFFLEVSKGNISNYAFVVFQGINETISTSYEVLSPAGGTFVFPTSGSTLSIVSTSANDDSGGTGANTLALTMLDTNYDEVVELVTMDGTTPVVTTTSDVFRLNSANTVLSGSSFTNEGVITITHGALTLGQIPISGSGLNQAVNTIPAGITAFSLDFSANCGKDDEVHLQAIIRPFGTNTSFVVANIFLYQNNLPIPSTFVFPLTEKSDYFVQAKKTGAAGNARVATLVQGIWVKNSEF